MAKAYIPVIGSGENQYCEECAHTDCKAAREFLASPCITCGTPMRDADSYYTNEDGPEHSYCCESRIEHEQKQVAK